MTPSPAIIRRRILAILQDSSMALAPMPVLTEALVRWAEKQQRKQRKKK